MNDSNSTSSHGPHLAAADAQAPPRAGSACDLTDWYWTAAQLALLVALVGGLWAAVQAAWPEMGVDSERLAVGRWQMVHGNLMLWGFLANGFWGGLHHVVPRLTRRSEYSTSLSQIVFWTWQLNCVALVVGILCGEAQGVSWNETPLWLDSLIFVDLVLLAVNFGVPIARCARPVPLPLWLILTALLWGPVVYALSSIMPELQLSGRVPVTAASLGRYGLLWLFAVPMSLGLVGALSGTDRVQRASWICWCVFAVAAPLAVFTQADGWEVRSRSADLWGMLSDVSVLVLLGLMALQTRHDQSSGLNGSTWSWFLAGAVFWGIGTIARQPGPDGHLPLTILALARSHLAIAGACSCWLFAVMSSRRGRSTPSAALGEPFARMRIACWTLSVALLSLTWLVSGWQQLIGRGSWRQLQPEYFHGNSSAVMTPDQRLIPVICGGALLLVTLAYCAALVVRRCRRSVCEQSAVRPSETESVSGSEVSEAPVELRYQRTVGWVLIVSPIILALGFVLQISGSAETDRAEVLVNAEVRYQFEDLARRYPEAFTRTYGRPPQRGMVLEQWLNERAAASLRYGRSVYIAEGCWHCHAQRVFDNSFVEERHRRTSLDAFWSELHRPPMHGTGRLGPVLTFSNRSNDWHMAHLFDPRLVRPDSSMPAYPWLFDGAPDRPNQRALAVITYLHWVQPTPPTDDGDGKPEPD